MEKFEIERRDVGSEIKFDRSPEWLRKKYQEERLSMVEIGVLCDVLPETVSRWMDRLGIEKRETVKRPNGGRYTDEDWLKEKYCEEGLPIQEIANSCTVHYTTILYWLEKFGIK